jgi:hypothetical protein
MGPGNDITAAVPIAAVATAGMILLINMIEAPAWALPTAFAAPLLFGPTGPKRFKSLTEFGCGWAD